MVGTIAKINHPREQDTGSEYTASATQEVDRGARDHRQRCAAQTAPRAAQEALLRAPTRAPTAAKSTKKGDEEKVNWNKSQNQRLPHPEWKTPSWHERQRPRPQDDAKEKTYTTMARNMGTEQDATGKPQKPEEKEAKMCRDGRNGTPTQHHEESRKHNRNTGGRKQMEYHTSPQGKGSGQAKERNGYIQTWNGTHILQREGQEMGAPKGRHRKRQGKQTPDMPVSDNQVQEGETVSEQPEGKEGRHTKTSEHSPQREQRNNEGGTGTTTNKRKGSTPRTTARKGKERN
ncbi:hypothetical protein NDU88_002361 [Pleurodeles waltl]|uniref:Uncharacterized protein n=1 Tax=Pleurodeles waltl TaxID=8319 RepID=A0AAV7WL02_PLEWA|nr:hypothetical protein NDU88_002361 [Pleurodeles waltl]